MLVAAGGQLTVAAAGRFSAGGAAGVGTGGGGGGGGSGGALLVRAPAGLTAAAAAFSALGGAGATSNMAGGAGGRGRIRLDTPGVVAAGVTSPAAYRGPAWASIAELIVRTADVELQVFGQPSRTFGIRVGQHRRPRHHDHQCRRVAGRGLARGRAQPGMRALRPQRRCGPRRPRRSTDLHRRRLPALNHQRRAVVNGFWTTRDHARAQPASTDTTLARDDTFEQVETVGSSHDEVHAGVAIDVAGERNGWRVQ